jgi:hypothetical protein
MKKSRFKETQIVSILRQHEAGKSTKDIAENMASVRRRFTIGKLSTVDCRLVM